MGHIHIEAGVPSPPEHTKRTVRVYTPPEYDAWPRARFPVLYMQDGQNVFAHHASAHFDTWCVNHVLERLVQHGVIEPWMVVAVDSGPGRIADYSPWQDETMDEPGRAGNYLCFMRDHLKPFIDRMYRTRAEGRWTTVAGSSLGGLVSLHMAHESPEVFGRVGAFSPSVMWARHRMFSEWRAHSRQWTRLYLDAGEQEVVHVSGVRLDYGHATRAFHQHLRSLGYADWELRLVLEQHGEHHETAWQRRLPDAFAWLLG
jgi:predicted alpha/beta superfamily hydrolase